VRRHELAGFESGRAIAEACQHLALGAVDAHSRADVGHVVVHAEAAADLADVESPLGTALEVQARGAMHVVPLGFVFPVAVEHLDAMVLAVGHVHPAVGVAADVMGDVELARIGAGLPPRAKQGAVRRVLVDA
jgi:hypothetical protein